MKLKSTRSKKNKPLIPKWEVNVTKPNPSEIALSISLVIPHGEFTMTIHRAEWRVPISQIRKLVK